MSEQALEIANVAERIEEGFPAYSASFASDPAIGTLAASHPFDSHPPLSERLGAVGVPLDTEQIQTLLAAEPDGQWFQHIRDAEQIERQQWDIFEERFRQYHKYTLPYRFLPETENELEIVLKEFPGVQFKGPNRTLTLDYEKITYTAWDDPVWYREIEQITLEEGNLLQIARAGAGKRSIYIYDFPVEQEDFLEAVNRYYSRYLMAAQYQEQEKLGDASSE